MTNALDRVRSLIGGSSWKEAREALGALTTDEAAKADAAALRALVEEASGNVDGAIRIVESAIALHPYHLGLADDLVRLSHRQGDLRQIGKAVAARLRLSPERADLWNDLGVVAERLGDDGAASSRYRRASSLAPDSCPALMNAAALAYRHGFFGHARELASRAAAVDPMLADAHTIVGHASQCLAAAPPSGRSYRRALAAAPAASPPWEGLAATFRRTNAHDAALACVRRTRSIDPTSPTALANLCESLRTCGANEEALSAGRRSVVLAPGSALGTNGVALALSDLLIDDAAERWSRRSVALSPRDAELMINLGITLKAQARFAEAEAWLRAGLAARPDDANGHLALATCLLAAGKLREGFAEYEWRLSPHRSYGVLPAPRWDGSPMSTGALLVWGEQGIGDEMLFIQYVRKLKGRVRHVVVACDPRLISIFSRSFPGTEFVARTDPPAERLLAGDIKAQVPLLSLPHVLGLEADGLVSEGPFLKPDQRRMDQVARALGSAALRPRVGIAWRSTRPSVTARRVHADLSDWLPVLSLPDVEFVSLQYGNVLPEFDQLRARFGLKVRILDGLDLLNDMEGALALGASLPLVVSTVTSASFPAIAAGTETWLLLSDVDYFAFGAGRYLMCPSSRSFVRKRWQSWHDVAATMAKALSDRVRGRLDRNDGR